MVCDGLFSASVSGALQRLTVCENESEVNRTVEAPARCGPCVVGLLHAWDTQDCSLHFSVCGRLISSTAFLERFT